MISTKIHSMIDTFTPTEIKIANYLIENKELARTMTSYDLSEKLGIGQSNIIRFSQKLGYKGFRDLQLDIHINQDEEFKEINEDDSTEITNNKIVQQYVNIARTTNSLNSPAMVDDCIKKIIASNRIIVYGVGNSNLFAEYLSNHLLKMRLNSFSSSNAHIIYSTASGFNSNDLVILVSETGETREIIKLAKIAKLHQIPIIAITRLAKNRLLKYADFVLYTCNDLSSSRLNATTIRCSQLCIIDMLTLNILKSDFKKYKKYINESEKLLSEKYYGSNDQFI